MHKQLISLTVNGRLYETAVDPNQTLLRFLREQLGFLDVKNGCEKGDCGACSVLLDGKAVNSCLVLACQANGSEIITNAGLGSTAKPHPIQSAYADAGGVQCGFCTPGMIIATKALLDENPHPSEGEIREALEGNLCRCTGYGLIVKSVQLAAERLSGDGGAE